MNPDLPSAINQWHIVFDPYGFSESKDWLDQAEKSEDILQLAHVYADGPVIDVGFYNSRYKAFVIRGADWTHPYEEFVSDSHEEMTNWVYMALTRYENGF